MNKSLLSRAGTAVLSLAVAATAFAGNIPQYSVKASNNLYSPLSGATRIHSVVEGSKTSAIFANGSVSSEGQAAMGFPIGFDFIYGGQTVNQFVPTTHGAVFFGKDYVRVASDPSLALKAGDHMGYETMVAGVVPAEEDVKAGDISYLTTGEAGNRVCTIQFYEITLDEKNQWGSRVGIYSYQMRLYEKDNKLEIALQENEYPAMMNKLFMGLRGWDSTDGLFMKSANLRKNGLERSTSTSGSVTDYESLISWDNWSNGMEPANVCFAFTPSTDTTLPSSSPRNLTVTEEDNVLTIKCDKAPDAASTVILISETPFTDADYPVDGATFPIKQFRTGDKYVTTFGKATAIYYGQDENIELKYSNIQAGTNYYVAAVSANGVPMYDKAHAAVFTMSSANEAPTNVSVMPGETSLTVSWECPVDAIVAMTTERLPYEEQKYPFRTTGKFGVPTVSVSEGDELEGGGKVIYVGSDNEITVDVPANEMVYFSLWSKEGEVISSTASTAYGVTYASLPFEPKLEERNYNLVPAGWTSSDNGLSYRVLRRPGDNADALYAISENDEPVFESPLMTIPKDATIEFEYSLETAADAGMAGGGDISKGVVPGYFGLSATDQNPSENYGLWLSLGDTRVKTVNKYEGTLNKDDNGAFLRGSSSFERFEAVAPELENNRVRLRIGFRTYNISELWLRKLVVKAAEGSGIDGISGEEISLVAGGKGTLSVIGAQKVDVFSIDGRKVASVEGPAVISLPAGIYVANGCKVLVK